MNAELFARPLSPIARWQESDKGARRLIELADRHYTRQQPGTNQCCRPGVNFVLLLSDGSAAWVVWRPIPKVGRKDGLEAWECTLFRNEGRRLSSGLIKEAAEITFNKWGWPPRHGFITSVGVSETRARRSRQSRPGHCFLMAGWKRFRHPSKDKSKIWLRAPHPARLPLSDSG